MTMGLQGFQNGFPTCLEFLELIQSVPDGGDNHLIQAAGGLLAIAGNKWNGGILFEQIDTGLHIVRLEFEFIRNNSNMVWCHDCLSYSWLINKMELIR